MKLFYLAWARFSIAILLFLGNFLSHASYAAYNEGVSGNYKYQLTFDKNFSSHTFSDYSLSAMELYRALDGKIFKNKKDNFLIRITSMATQLAAAGFTHIINHEVGGHGYRLREMGMKGIEYELGIFSGRTECPAEVAILHMHKRVAMTAGGSQAAQVAANGIEKRYMELGEINPVHGISYIFNQGDLPGYIFITKKEDNSEGNDIDGYIKEINNIYGDGHVTLGKLKAYAWLSLLDPYLWYSAYSYGKQESIDIPMLSIGGIKYLPAVGAVFAPYGIEGQFKNHFKIGEQYYKATLTMGKNKDINSYGLALSTGQIMKIGPVSLGLDLAWWSQPELLTADPLSAKNKNGFLSTLNAEVGITKNTKLVTNIGYKSAGFALGYPLEKAFLIRAGAQFNF